MSANSPPYSGNVTALIALSGRVRVDALLGGSKWGVGPDGSAAQVTFGFPTDKTFYDNSSGFGHYGHPELSGYMQSPVFARFGSVEQAAVREVLQSWANVANITLTEVPVDSQGAADLRFNYTGPPGLAYNMFATSWFPMDVPAGGDTWINAGLVYQDNWATGGQNRLTLLHETGHALGLKHPHDTGVSWLGSGWPLTTATLPIKENSILAFHSSSDTVMAYNHLPGIDIMVQADFAPTTPMRLDIAAIQYLYGANLGYHAGDTIYTYQAAGRYHETIWDGGGNDTIAVNGDSASVINLTPGGWSQLGLPITFSERNTDLTVATPRPDLTRYETVHIYDKVIIENARGGGGNDFLVGNAVANQLHGNAGNDHLHGAGGDDIIVGGDGIDTAGYAGMRGNFSINGNGTSWVVQDLTGKEGTDSLSGCERLSFVDVKVALDLDGNAGQVARLLGAVFSTAAVGNRAYAGIGISLMDGGMSYGDLAQLAIDVSGPATPEQVVNLLWNNVVGGAPSAGQSQPFVDMLNSGMTTGALTVLAADTELNRSNINLLGLAQTGLDYTEYPV